MKPRDYCCCAIPVVNAGIYATLTEQLVLGILVGVLSMATPSIVGAATPSFAPWILGIVSLVAGGIQILGFIGVLREKAILYRRYVTLHIMATVATFAIAAAWIIISASRHSTAQSNCENDFFKDDTNTVSEGQTLCNIFPWVDVGIMGGLWALLAIVHFYFYIIVSSYGTSQRRDHEKYDALYDPTNPLANDSIQMNNRNDPWDSRASTDSLHDPVNHVDRGYTHVRQESNASASDVMGAHLQQPKDGFSNPSYGYQQGTYPPQSQGYLDRKASKAGSLSHPGHAYTQDPGPTPSYGETFYADPSAADLDKPAHSQAHPAEGSFHRKTPRLTKPY